jgi:hypothetical protein
MYPKLVEAADKYEEAVFIKLDCNQENKVRCRSFLSQLVDSLGWLDCVVHLGTFKRMSEPIACFWKVAVMERVSWHCAFSMPL